MRVLLASDFYAPVQGGLEHHVKLLGEELSALGHTVLVATLTTTPTQGAVQVESVRSASRFLPHADRAKPFHLPCADPIARLEFHNLLKRFPADIIHAHSWIGASVPSRVPVVQTLHDYGLICSVRTFWHQECRPCAGPALRKCASCGSSRLGPVAAHMLPLITNLGRHALSPRRFLAVSNFIADAVQPFLAERPTVIPNFTRLPVETPEPSVNKLRPQFIFAGDPGRHKGLDVLLAAWHKFMPDADLLLCTTQPLPSSMVLPSTATALHLSHEATLEAIARSAVLVAPSVWPDPAPTVLLEALARGIPVIASRIGGIPEIVRDNVDGLLVPPNDVDLLGSALLKMLDSSVWGQMSIDARSRSRSFSAGEVVPLLVDQYRLAIEQQ